METHAHRGDRPSGRKIWPYFYEFLMLFLAVFAGFLAENQREHFVEGRKEKEFMGSLVKDLQLDVSQFSRLAEYRRDRLRTLGDLLSFYSDHAGSPVPAYGYELAAKLFGHAAFFQNSGTLDQLKSSGGFRLIRRRNVVDAIEAYDQQTKRIALRDIYEADYSFDNSKLLRQLADGRALLNVFEDTSHYKKPATPATPIELHVEYLGEYLNSLRTFQFLVKADMELQAAVKEKASQLISLITTEYRLD